MCVLILDYGPSFPLEMVDDVMFENVGIYVILIISSFGGMDYARAPGGCYSTLCSKGPMANPGPIIRYTQEEYGACQAHAEWLTGMLPGGGSRALCVPAKFMEKGKNT